MKLSHLKHESFRLAFVKKKKKKTHQSEVTKLSPVSGADCCERSRLKKKNILRIKTKHYDKFSPWMWNIWGGPTWGWLQPSPGIEEFVIKSFPFWGKIYLIQRCLPPKPDPVFNLIGDCPLWISIFCSAFGLFIYLGQHARRRSSQL